MTPPPPADADAAVEILLLLSATDGAAVIEGLSVSGVSCIIIDVGSATAAAVAAVEVSLVVVSYAENEDVNASLEILLLVLLVELLLLLFMVVSNEGGDDASSSILVVVGLRFGLVSVAGRSNYYSLFTFNPRRDD